MTWSQLADNKFGYLTADVAPTDTTIYTNFDPWVSSGRLLIAISDTTFEYLAFSAVSGSSSPYTITIATNGRLMDQVAIPSTGGTTGLSWNAGTRVELVAMHDQIGQVEIPVLPANGGTGTSTVFTAGSVVFSWASGVYTQDNAHLFWDDTNNCLGIGTNTPSWALSMGNATGPKIAIFDSGSGAGYGFGVQSNVLQIMTYSSSTRVGIGYGTSGSFTETLSVINGSVGIGGITSPTTTLYVGGTFGVSGVSQFGTWSGGISPTTGILKLYNSSNTNTLTIQPWTTSASYTITLPTAVASAGQTLIDAAGNGVLSWGNQPWYSSRVFAYQSTGQTISSSSATVVSFDTKSFDGLTEFSTSTNTFTASSAGYYLVNVKVSWQSIATIQQRYTAIYVNGSVYTGVQSSPPANATDSQDICCLVSLSANGTIAVKVDQVSGSSTTLTATNGGALGGYATFLSIHRLS